MSFFGFLMFLLVASICGGIGQSIGGYKLGSGGCLMSAVVGFVGAFLGTWMARELGFPELWTISIDGEPFPVVWSIVGGAFLTAILGFVFREGEKRSQK